MQYEVELLGYTDIKDVSLPHDMYMITKLETNNWGTCFASLYQCNSGIQKTIKFGKIKKKPYIIIFSSRQYRNCRLLISRKKVDMTRIINGLKVMNMKN